jgi:hypothetical protein
MISSRNYLDQHGSVLPGGRPLASGTHSRVFHVIHGLADILTGLRFGKHFALPIISRDACIVAFQRGRKFFGSGLVLRQTGGAPGAKKADCDKSTVHLNSPSQYCRLAGLAHRRFAPRYFEYIDANVTLTVTAVNDLTGVGPG